MAYSLTALAQRAGKLHIRIIARLEGGDHV